MNLSQNMLDLRHFGLGDKESKIYLAMLQMGPSSVQKVATESHIHRITTYRHISSLQAKGLVSSIQKGKRTQYFARSPEALSGKIREEERELKEKRKVLGDLLPQLRALHSINRTKPVVMYYEGNQGFKDTFDYMITELKWTQADCYRIFSQNRATLYSFFQRLTPAFIKQRQRLGVRCLAISTHGYLEKNRNVEKLDHMENTQRRIISHKFFFTTFQYILKNSVIVFSLENNHFIGVIIQHPAMATTQRTLFDHIWETARPFHKRGAEK